MLEENLKNTQEYIQEGAVVAYKYFSRRFFGSFNEFNEQFLNELVSR